jgi:hypothetical protein
MRLLERLAAIPAKAGEAESAPEGRVVLIDDRHGIRRMGENCDNDGRCNS